MQFWRREAVQEAPKASLSNEVISIVAVGVALGMGLYMVSDMPVR
jgi:hypothetical protein